MPIPMTSYLKDLLAQFDWPAAVRCDAETVLPLIPRVYARPQPAAFERPALAAGDGPQGPSYVTITSKIVHVAQFTDEELADRLDDLRALNARRPPLEVIEGPSSPLSDARAIASERFANLLALALRSHGVSRSFPGRLFNPPPG